MNGKLFISAAVVLLVVAVAATANASAQDIYLFHRHYWHGIPDVGGVGYPDATASDIPQHLTPFPQHPQHAIFLSPQEAISDAYAEFYVTDNFGVLTENDTIASGTYDVYVEYGFGVANIDDDSDTVLGELNYSVQADNIGKVYFEEYAERRGTWVNWTFPSEFDLIEDDWLWTGYSTNYTETRYVPMSLSRWMNETVFDSEGYQLAKFSVTFNNTNFDWAWAQIIADEYNEIEEVDASFLPDTFSTDIPYWRVLKEKHKIWINIDTPEIEPSATYNFSVVVKVGLTDNEASPIMYKPFFQVGVGLSFTHAEGATGSEIVMPDDMLPEHVRYASASTNISNIWDLSVYNQLCSALIEISEPILPPTIFDTGFGTYPSIMGTHKGTIKPNHTVIATKLYTYACEGTGGHTEYARIWNETWEANATWEGYAGDWHNISFDKPVVLLAGETYFYEIRTGSYPQIHHTDALLTANGWMNCTEFTDANGKVYHDWIPAIKLF